jgi:two-component sensor histidine kinase
MTWQEMGGPPVRVPNDEGFGMRLIRRSLAAELRGEVNMDFAESGLICRIAGRLA